VVTEIANSANVANIGADQITNFDVKVLILEESYGHLFPENPGGRFPFLPGMSATVDIRTRTRHDILAIPVQAVTTRADSLLLAGTGNGDNDIRETGSGAAGQGRSVREVVFMLASDNTVQLRKVETGIQDNNYIEITGGLEEGDEVITAPYSAIIRTLQQGSRVNVVDRTQLFN
jgi:HlyD family secretion protein